VDRKKTLDNLEEFIKIQSVSTDPSRFVEILKAIHFLQERLIQLGFNTYVMENNDAPPLVIGEKLVNPKAKTIGIYGHYDVQPEEPVDEWQTPPFVMSLKNGKIYGRGVADNKGHVIQNLAAVENLIKTNKLENNIVFIIEGEEETGSPHLAGYLKKAGNRLSIVDVFYITDMGMHQKNIPQIFYSLRGLIYFELEIIIGNRDLHSGIYGNRVFNPINVLADLIAKMKNIKTGEILIPGFSDGIRQPVKSEIDLLLKTVRQDVDEIEEAKTYGLMKVARGHSSLASKIYPSFDGHGIISGYTKEGQKTIIPKSAIVKFSFRLVPDQNPDRIEKLVGDFIKKNLPQEVRFKLKNLSKGAPFYTDINNKYVRQTAKNLSRVFNHEVLFNRSGGSIEAAAVFQSLFQKPIVLTGFTLPDDNIHSPNENFDEEMFWKGIEALIEIYK